MATFHPALRTRNAATVAAVPVPMMTRSCCIFCFSAASTNLERLQVPNVHDIDQSGAGHALHLAFYQRRYLSCISIYGEIEFDFVADCYAVQ